ncbi:MAG TPA: Hsp33 family molecular chaperone HslO [Anaeromyxobacteraceae bacterium]|nr:Hsp33 family molecular chaperone HslO [Anaeromyxobacteraceae bacterium]
MPDRLVRGLLPSRGLRVVHVRVTETAQAARALHGLYPTSAHLFAQSLAGGLLVSTLHKERSRVNLQLECDGPARGLFVDARPDGTVRGYIRAPHVHFPGDPTAGARAALGGSGFLSIMHDLGDGNFYRGQVELRALDVPADLGRYFAESEQIATAVDIAVVPNEGEPLGEVSGLIVQRLPGGDEVALETARAQLATGILWSAGSGARGAIASIAGDDFELLAELEVAYRCGCSVERARAAVSALGRGGILDVLAKEGEATVTCEFCHRRYLVTESELRAMVHRFGSDDDFS